MSLTLITYLKNTELSKNETYIHIGLTDTPAHKTLEVNKNIIRGSEENLKLHVTKESKINSLNYCERLYEKIIENLTLELNNLHNENYEKRIWRIILGRWLKEFIYTTYLNFNTIERALKTKKITKIITTKFEKKNFFIKDYLNFINLYLSAEWISNLNGQIINYLNPNIDIDYIEIDKKLIQQEVKIEKNSDKITYILTSFLNKFLFKKKNNFFFYKTGFSFLYEKYLEYKADQKFSFWQIPEADYKDKHYNSDLRKKLNINFEASNSYEDFIKKNLNFYLPMFLIEEFKNINYQILKSNLPKKLDLILTGTGFTNDVFNIFCARQMSKNAKFVNFQHGNCYNTWFLNDYVFEYKDSDIFLSWGKKINKNQISAFNFKVILKKQSFNKKGNLSIICDSLAVRARPFEVFPTRYQNFENSLSFVKDLKLKIKNKTYFKLLKWDGDNTYDILSNKIKINNFNLYNEKMSFRETSKLTKLNIFNYDSTGFYESLILNTPSIIYDESIFENLRDDCVNDYKMLMQGKLLFTNKSDLLNHINEVWENPLIWWNNTKTKKIIRDFNFKYNINYNQEFNSVPNVVNQISLNNLINK